MNNHDPYKSEYQNALIEEQIQEIKEGLYDNDALIMEAMCQTDACEISLLELST